MMQRPINCLLIDDDIDDHLIFHMAIQDKLPQARCFFSTSCRDAIQQLTIKNFPVPDVVFLDLNLPETTPEQSLSALGSMVDLQYTKLFVLSGALPSLPLEKLRSLGVKKSILKQDSIQVLADQLYMAIYDS